jgi:FkbM family methyltransferase
MFNKVTKPIKELSRFEEEHENKTGLEGVHLLHADYKWVKKVKSLKQMRTDHQLTSQEMQKTNVCVKNFPHDYWKGQHGFWNASEHEIRRTHHTYLVPGKSIVIEVGGNIGDTAQVFLDMYKPKHYVILEPIRLLHRQLLRRFRFYNNAIIYNIGLGSSNKEIMVNIEGKNGVATSQWGQSGKGSSSLKVVNATQFFEKLGVGNFMVDLITINCEGCEYDLLETLLSTHFVYYFKNIQFGSHTKIKGLPDPVGRYCRLQQLLRRNHVMTYQHIFTWENWQLKDKFRK